MTVTARGWGGFGAVAALWIAGRALGVAELQVLAVAAAVVALSALAWGLVAVAGLTITRQVRPAVLAFGEQGHQELRVTNTSRRRTPPVELIDHAPLGLLDDEQTALAALRPGERRPLQTTVHGRRRGRARLGPVLVRARDPFGLVVRTRTIAAPGSVIVMPEVVPLPPGLPLGGASSAVRDRRVRTQLGGDELADLREYVRGDDLRSVHWPSTAHRGRLMVRRSEGRLAPSATVVLDRRTDAHRGTGPQSSFEVAVRAAASVCRHLHDRGRSVTLLDAPTLGRPQADGWDTLVQRLAEVQTGPVDLAALLGQVADGLAGDGTVIVVARITSAEDLRAVVRAGRGFNSRAALVVDADPPAPPGRPGTQEPPSAATSAAALRSAGWRAAPVGAGDRLADQWTQQLVGAGPGVASAPARSEP